MIDSKLVWKHINYLLVYKQLKRMKLTLPTARKYLNYSMNIFPTLAVLYKIQKANTNRQHFEN